LSARIEWSKRMFWLTASTAASSQASTTVRAVAKSGAIGFCTRIPLMCGRLAASITISGC
jgi:hypothetical protein